MSENALPLDHYLDVSISSDKLETVLLVKEMDDHFSCTAAGLTEFLAGCKVVYGLRTDALEAFARDPRRHVNQPLTVAAGIPPKSGEDGAITFLQDLNSDTKKPKVTGDGTVDLKEVITLHNVNKGQLIAERQLATEGQPGMTVTGEAIAPKPGKEARFKLGKNVVTDPDRMKLYATIDGLITKTDKDKINVFPIYEVNGDLDYNIGNIDFVGTVIIRGSVLSGFKVKAGGDIRVTGSVDGAELEAAGSIEISAGILGHNKGIVRAGVNIKSSFIQDATVIAAGSIMVSQSIMHSNIQAGGKVECMGSKGLIVGGLIQAGEMVVARTIGNTMSTPTSIEVGVNPELRNELQEIRAQLRTNMDNSDKTEKALIILDQLASMGKLTGEKLAMRVKLNHSKKQLAEEQMELKERMLEIEKSLENSDKAKLEVIHTVYGGTKIVIGRYTRFVKDPTIRVVFRLADGEIAMLSL